MSDVFAFLSEFWLRFAEKIDGAIFSFVFFWSTLPFMYHFEKNILDLEKNPQIMFKNSI